MSDIDIQQYIDPARSLDVWRTEIPNLYDEADLDVYEFRLLVHYVRVGKCWESTKTTANTCKMSAGKVSQARRSLEEKNFITIQKEADKETLVIKIVDKWSENFEKYHQRSRGERKNLKELLNFFNSRGERVHRPMTAWVGKFGKFENEDQAYRVYMVYETYGKELYFDVLAWLEGNEYKYMESRIKAMETAAKNWKKNEKQKQHTPEVVGKARI